MDKKCQRKPGWWSFTLTPDALVDEYAADNHIKINSAELTADALRIEGNFIKMMSSIFSGVTDFGHDDYGDIVGMMDIPADVPELFCHADEERREEIMPDKSCGIDHEIRFILDNKNGYFDRMAERLMAGTRTPYACELLATAEIQLSVPNPSRKYCRTAGITVCNRSDRELER